MRGVGSGLYSLRGKTKTQKRSFLIRCAVSSFAQLIFLYCRLSGNRTSEEPKRNREKYGSSWRWWHGESWIGESSTHLHSRLRHRYFLLLFQQNRSIDFHLLLTYVCFILILPAMQAEAQPLVNKFGLSETSDSPLRPLPHHSFWFSANQ